MFGHATHTGIELRKTAFGEPPQLGEFRLRHCFVEDESYLSRSLESFEGENGGVNVLSGSVAVGSNDGRDNDVWFQLR
jgi:hypothetical protein